MVVVDALDMKGRALHPFAVAGIQYLVFQLMLGREGRVGLDDAGERIDKILGYSATAFGLEPWCIYLFLVGLLEWFLVRLLWNDRALILIHPGALSAVLAGLVS